MRAFLAQVAELVDALGSGPSACKGVEVRVLSWAPSFLPRSSKEVQKAANPLGSRLFSCLLVSGKVHLNPDILGLTLGVT